MPSRSTPYDASTIRWSRLAGLLPALMVLGFVSQASAQSMLRQRAYRSERHFAIEFKGGPYSPDVDEDFADLPAEERPHQKYFGNKRRPMFQLEVDYLFFKQFGSLGAGLNFGWMRERARGFIEPEGGGEATERSGDRTSLTLIPIAASLVYRFDVLARRYTIPLVPYVKGGIDYAMWFISDGNGNISDPADDSKGSGATLGWHAAVGIAFLLDIFDQGSAQELDAEIGVNHTYLIAEMAHYDISDFGAGSALRLGDTTWHVGLLFEL